MAAVNSDHTLGGLEQHKCSSDGQRFPRSLVNS